MQAYAKENFLGIIKINPKYLLGKQIIYEYKTAKILDITIDGGLLLIEYISRQRNWITASSLDSTVVVDTIDTPTVADSFTIGTVSKDISLLKEYVGNPGSEPIKPLYDIVAVLNKELLELKLKIEEMEKSKTYTASST